MAVHFSSSANDICRLCLHKVEAYLNIFEGKYDNLIKVLTSLEISEDDGLPKIACINCIHELHLATKIKMRITDCHKKLEKLVVKNNHSSSKPVSNHLEYQISTLADSSRTIDDSDMINDDSKMINDDSRMINDDNSQMIKDEFNTVNSDFDMANDNFITVSDDSITDNIDQHFELTHESLNAPKAQCTKKGICVIYLCKKCGKTFYDDVTFKIHLSNHNKKECKRCGLLVKTENMNKHLEFHQGGQNIVNFKHVTTGNKYKCEVCQRSFSRKYSLMRHKSRSHILKVQSDDDSSSICEICGRMFKNPSHLKEHVRYHNLSDKYKCDECSKGFKRKKDLDRHKRQVHERSQKLECDYCGKKFSNALSTTKHIRMKHSVGQYHKCEHCHRLFRNLYLLKYHMTKHTEETPYECTLCDAGFNMVTKLRLHMEIEHDVQKETQIVCEFCDRVYATEFAHKLHMDLHKDQYYECDQCQDCFQVKVLFVEHLRDVHGANEDTIYVKKYLKNLNDEAEETEQ